MSDKPEANFDRVREVSDFLNALNQGHTYAEVRLLDSQSWYTMGSTGLDLSDLDVELKLLAYAKLHSEIMDIMPEPVKDQKCSGSGCEEDTLEDLDFE